MPSHDIEWRVVLMALKQFRLVFVDYRELDIIPIFIGGHWSKEITGIGQTIST
jgi:hypothetical protein